MIPREMRIIANDVEKRSTLQNRQQLDTDKQNCFNLIVDKYRACSMKQTIQKD